MKVERSVKKKRKKTSVLMMHGAGLVLMLCGQDVVLMLCGDSVS